jgi:C4-dicarboxylate transporter DctM subunit
MLAGIPVAFSIILSSAFFLQATGMRPLVLVAQRLVTGMDSFPLLAVPLFVLTGNIMDSGGISRRLTDWADTLVGGVSGGLGMVAIVSCAIFAALTGSGPATVAAIGSILIPSMVEQGYSKRRAAGIIAAAGALGPIIPPSIPMIVYGVTANLSIPQMFIGGIVPGLMIMVMLMLCNMIYSKKDNIKGNGKKFNLKEFFKATYRAMGALLMPIIILGGIYGGVFTPTEAAAVGVAYGFVVSVLFYKELHIQDFGQVLIKSAEVSAMVIFIIASANLLQWIMSATRMPVEIANFVVSFVHSKGAYLIMLNLLLFLVGALMDTVAAIIILAPILVPIGLQFGLAPLHLGVLFVINLVIGYVTPPFGYNLFTASSLTKLPLQEVVRGILPFLIMEIFAVWLLALFPEIITWLPGLLFN